MKKPEPPSTATTRPVASLKPHPRQAELFDDLCEPELAVLADDINQHGLEHPIEILPDGTVVAGHQRLRAVQRLGWTEVDVIIRHDLAVAGPAAAEAYLLRDNLRRRQMTPLARARCVAELVRLEEGRLACRGKEKIKKQVAESLGLRSGRSVNRYLAVLDAPLAVQQAFDRGEITLVNAGRVATLAKRQQVEIARRIDASEPAQKVVAEALVMGGQRRQAWHALADLVATLSKACTNLHGRAAEIPPHNVRRVLPCLKESRQLLDELIGWADTESDT